MAALAGARPVAVCDQPLWESAQSLSTRKVQAFYMRRPMRVLLV